MKQVNLIRAFVLIILVNVISSNFIKTWTNDFNKHPKNTWIWDKNWCPRDRLIIPDNSVIYLIKSFHAQPMVLPFNGEIILGNDAQIISGKAIMNQIENCQGEDKYYFLKEEEWLNPHNWATQLNGKLVEGQLSANPIPHTDRIPCRGDDVIFPDQATIKVKISLSQDLMLSSLRLNNVQFSNDSLNRFLATKTGQMIFRNTNRRLLINSQLSTNNVCDKQCPCDTERSQLIDQICPLITCQAINCENAIQPPGHCCPLCAVMVKVLPKDGLNFVDFNRLFTNYIKNQLNDGSIGYAYSIEDKSMIAVFTNPQEFSSQKILSHGHNFMDILYYDYQFRHSSMELYPEEKNSFFTNFILLLLAVALAYALYSGINYYRRNEIRISWPRARSRFRPSSQFTFIRFRGLEEAERATMELETATDIVASVSSLAKESSLEKKESTMLSLIPEEFFSVSNEVNHLHDNDERGKTATISESLFHDDSQMDTISLDKLIN